MFHGFPIANHTVCALHYSDPWLPHSVVGAAPPLSLEDMGCLPLPHFPTYQTPLPEHQSVYNTYYSEASLEGLVRVQLCMDMRYCIGILLHYETYSKTVGQIRYDKEIRDFLDPCSFGLAQERHDTNPRIQLQVFDERSTEEIKNLYLRLLGGTIVWWYGTDMSVVSILSP